MSWEGRKPSAELPSTRTNILSGCINFTMLYFPDGLAMLIGREPEISRSHSAHTLFSRPLHLVRYNKAASLILPPKQRSSSLTQDPISHTKPHLVAPLHPPPLSAAQLSTPTGQTLKPYRRLSQEGEQEGHSLLELS